ncbi:MAG: UDP-N-acetylmuramoyl-L-alanyl-D-glutamate--2,6-diaminopimelate ligase [Clostridiales bacterium]|nr:UDP-N-acetylmuramoyl-L-alanyl-D-glutamate--2,6-diaminopimelate ligase [Clostridiales bacterium]
MSKERIVNDFIRALEEAGLILSVSCENDNRVTSITYNSKEVKEGTLFACKGVHFKEQYLDDAIQKGAVCYVSEKEYSKATDKCTEIIVKDIRQAMSIISETFYENLSDEIAMVGITGTKGKSTTAYFMRYILDDYMLATGGNRSAICSGIVNYDGVIEEDSHLTTPEAMELYFHMDNAINSNIKYMTMEVSSQALKYGRVDGITFEVGCFLNIGTDHISNIEHTDFEDYFNSKLKLFEKCRHMCINLDCEGQEEIKLAAQNCPDVITFSRKDKRANVYGYDVKSSHGKVSFKANISGVKGYKDTLAEFTLGTFGTINIENALSAISMSAVLGVPVSFIQSGLAKAISPGRMEVFYSEDGNRIAVVDYAHNKLSYEKFFETIGDEFPDKKIIIVFGCPGGKAFARREELGTIAGERCTYSIITEEDAGEESVEKICEEVATFVRKAGGDCEIITDREEAIKKAISLMDDNTMLFVPGKGRETTQKRGIEYVKTLSDAEAVEKYLQ